MQITAYWQITSQIPQGVFKLICTLPSLIMKPDMKMVSEYMDVSMRVFPALLLVIFSPCLFAQVAVTLDRYSLSAADTLNLTLEAADLIQQRPDLTPLQQDFRILGSQRVVVSSHSSASRAVATRWHLQLRPLNTGNLTLPSLRLGDQFSEPVSITVTGAVHNRAQPDNLFLKSQLSQNRIYSHAQLIYTARLFQRAAITQSPEFYPPSMSGALVVKLTEPRTYKADHNGESWHVSEQTFALFPSEVGLHTVLGAEIKSDGPGSPYLAPERFEVEVLPPAHENSRGYWLPAERISLDENWSTQSLLQPGETFVREITLTALGLPADALPPLFTQRHDDYFAQKEDVSLTETQTPQGLISTRTERIRIEPLGPGTLTMPAIDLYWWNTLSGQAETATLPTRTIEIDEPAPVVFEPELSPENTATPSGTDPWSKIALGLGLICLLSIAGWARTWRQLRRERSRPNKDNKRDEEQRFQQQLLSHRNAEQEAFQDLAIACQENDAETARIHLLAWSRIFWPEQEIDSLESLCEAAHSQTMVLLILDLDQHLRATPQEWQGDLLLEAVDRLRQKRQRQSNSDKDPADEPLALAS